MLAGVSNDLTPQEITNVLDEVVLHMEVGSRTTCASSLRCSATLTAIERLSPGTWNGVADSGQRPRRAGTPESCTAFLAIAIAPIGPRRGSCPAAVHASWAAGAARQRCVRCSAPPPPTPGARTSRPWRPGPESLVVKGDSSVCKGASSLLELGQILLGEAGADAAGEVQAAVPGTPTNSAPIRSSGRPPLRASRRSPPPGWATSCP